MEKVINITIGKTVFYAEEEAFKKLSVYLESIGKHFEKDADKEEILEDIEVSIAEKFLALKKGRMTAVNLGDVEEVIRQMGTLKDFENIAAEDKEEKSEEKESFFEFKKKLYRNPDDVIIAGVASGVAAYLGVETGLVRLVFILSVLLGGAGIVIYLILWIILPVAETTAQKLNMRGERVTLKEIEKVVKRGVEKLKKKDGILSEVSGFLDKFFHILRSLAGTFGRILSVIFGVIFSVGGILGVCVLSFGLSWMISGGGIPYTDVQVEEFVAVTGASYNLFLVAVYFLILIPFTFVAITGISFLKRKNILKPIGLVILLLTWFASLGLVMSVVFQNLPLIEDRLDQVKIEMENAFEAR